MKRDAAQKAVLGAVREHLAQSRREGEATLEAPRPAESSSATVDRDALVREFAQRLGAVGGVAWRVGDLAAAAACIDELIAETHADVVAFADAPFTQRLREQVASTVDKIGPEDRHAIARCALGVTTARAAIAETGSLLLDAAQERYRLVSLLPTVHVAVVPVILLLRDLDEAFDLLGKAPSSAVTLVTGPSRTADIELTLVVGVHGPQALHVILVDRV